MGWQCVERAEGSARPRSLRRGLRRIEGRHEEVFAGSYMGRAQQVLAVVDCRGVGRASKAVAGHGTCQGSHLGPTSALTKDRAGDVSCQRLPDTQK